LSRSSIEKSLLLCWREFSKLVTEVASEVGGAVEIRGFNGAELKRRSITGLDVCHYKKKLMGRYQT